jgi:hypothetical protein
VNTEAKTTSSGSDGRRGSTLRHHEGLVWIAVLGGIPAWLFHLVFEAAMVGYTCTHPGWKWTLHAATVVTVVATLAGVVVCADLLRAGGRASRWSEDDDGSAAGRTRFLGALGLIVGATNVALILLEGSYVIFVNRCG